jgi:crotonobetaine/carnitine-CoA ligase
MPEEPSIADIYAQMGYPKGTSFADMLREMAAAPSDRLAVESDEGTFSYGEVVRRVAGAAALLEDRGIVRGVHTGFLFTPSIDALTTQLALLLVGAVVVPVYQEMGGIVLAERFNRLDVTAVVVSDDLRPIVDELLPTVPGITVVLDNAPDGDLARATLAGGDIQPFVSRDHPTPGDPALILSTSGTTGLPKGVVMGQSYSSGGYVASQKWWFDEPPKCNIATSWGHGAIQFAFSIAFWSGGSVVIAKRFSASRFWDHVRAHGITYAHLLGTMPRMLFNQPPRPDDRDHPIKFCVAAAMPVDIWEAFEERFGVKVIEIYGATDAGGCFTSNPGIYPPGSIGRPWKEMEAIVVDDDMNEVADGEIGELLMRVKGVEPRIAYYADEDASKEKTHGGWIHLGDFVTRDAEGNLYFVARKRELIRRRGINLAPATIEDALRPHPGIADVAALAVPSELGEDEVKVVVVPKEHDLTPASVAEFASGRLPAHMQPRYVEIATELPVTSATERVQRFVLRREWAGPHVWDCAAGAFMAEASA